MSTTGLIHRFFTYLYTQVAESSWICCWWFWLFIGRHRHTHRQTASFTFFLEFVSSLHSIIRWISSLLPLSFVLSKGKRLINSRLDCREDEPFSPSDKKKMAAIRKKLVIVGDGACGTHHREKKDFYPHWYISGKTCLLIVFSKDQFPEVYVPTVFENYVSDIEIDGKQVSARRWIDLLNVDVSRRSN